jgi:uncharacterized protein (TIGR00251 family)
LKRYILLYGLIYIVKIKFNALDTFVLDDNKKEIEISIRSAPIKGKANKEIIQKISNHFNVKANDVKIVSGFYSKTKLVYIFI